MPSWKKVITSGSAAALNSLTVSNGITSSLFGTASWAVSASQAITASYANFALTASNSQNAQDILIYVKNTTGAQINKGKVVRISGATGDNALIATASYESDGVSANTLGITNQDIPHDSFGYVITEGTLIGINTNAFSAGQLLYLGATGSIIGTAPVAPLHAVRLGQVLRVQINNGSMYVRIDNGYELGELHDVVDTTTTSSYGDLLVKSGSVWINSRQLSGSYGLTGSLNATSFTGSLFGTASFASTSSFLNSNTNAFIQNGNSFGATALLGTNDNNSLALETNGSTRMFVSSSGNVGIGTTTPTVALQIGDTTSGTGNYIKVLGNNSDSTYDVFVGARRYPRFTLEDTTAGGSAFQMWSLGNTMRFGTNTGTTETSAWYTKAGNAADVIFNGRIGIGVISPGLRLSVSASSSSDGIQVIQSGTSRIELKGDGTAVWGSAADFGRLTWDTGKAILQGQSGKALSLGANNLSDHLYISTSGDVGIGKTTPGAKLDVNGNVLITGSLNISGSVTATSFTGSLFGTSSWANNAQTASFVTTAQTASYVLNAVSSSFASTASFVNTLNQSVLITGSATIGATSAGASENSLTLGARDAANEGGQLGFNAPGGTYTSASFIDNWQNSIRILRGNNTTSDATVATWNLHTKQMQLPAYTSTSAFPGTATANLAVNSNGDVITVSTTGGTVFPYTGNAVITGSLTTTGIIYAQPNGGMYFQGGDDAALYDINVSNTMGVYGVQNSTVGAIKLGSNGPVLYGSGSSLGIGTTTPNSGALHVNGGVFASSFTGSLLGTASWATNVVNNGVTSVSASGTVSGITLGGGPITSTGTLTLSGTISGLTNSNLSGTAGITNANLATPSLMIGTTNIALGATGSTLAGLATVTATAFTGSFSGSYFGPLTGTSSYATQALSASFAPDTTFPYTGSALITGSLGITGSLDLIYNTASSNGISVTGHFPRLILVNSGSGATAAGGIISVRDNNFITKSGGAVVFSINATDAGSSSVGRIVFTKASNSSTNVSIWNSGTEGAFYISGSGNIGIGTTTPNAKLDVNGDAIITGSLTVTGRITAEEFHTEFVSSSIIYLSGSTKFGDSSDDVMSVTGSLRVNGSITGSLLGTASYATQALSASWAPTAATFPFTGSAIITGSLTVTGSTAITGSLNVTNPNGPGIVMNTSSIGRLTHLGDRSVDWTGRVLHRSGSQFISVDWGNSELKDINENTVLTWRNGMTGSLFGTSSWAVSASQALTASYAVSASSTVSSSRAVSSSYAVSSSNALTASFAVSSSYAVSSSNAATASWATNVTNNGVTSVSASGTVSGITLGGGTITSTGTLTLSGTVSGLTNSNLSGTAGITNANLATPSLMIGTTNIALGATGSTLAGLTTVSSTAFSGSFSGSHFGPLTGTATSASFASTASFLNGGTTNAFIQGGNSFGTTATLGTNDNQPLAFETNGTTAMFISSSGNVGIGTTSPTFKFEVNGAAKFNNYIRLSDGNNPWDIGSVFNYTNSDLFFSMNGSEKMRINTNGQVCIGYTGANATGANSLIVAGNVGIGTTSPDTNLDVVGDSLTVGSESTYSFRVRGGGGGKPVTISSDGSYAYIQSWSSGPLQINNQGNSTLINVNSGNVGIGTTSVSAAKFVLNSGTSNQNALINGDKIGFTRTSDAAEVVYFKKDTSLGTEGTANINGYDGIQFRTQGAETVKMIITGSGNVGIGTTTPGYKLDVNGDTNVTGTLTATVKSFIIDHPTKEGKKLQYGVLEGPEHSVYVRGKLTNNNTITLPDHWTGLVHEDTVTVNLTPIGKRQDLWVETVTDTAITVGSGNEINCFYTVFAERKDIEKLVTEFDK